MHHSPEDDPEKAPRVQCGDVTYVPLEFPITPMTPRTSDISFLQHYPSKPYRKVKYEVGQGTKRAYSFLCHIPIGNSFVCNRAGLTNTMQGLPTRIQGRMTCGAMGGIDRYSIRCICYVRSYKYTACSPPSSRDCPGPVNRVRACISISRPAWNGLCENSTSSSTLPCQPRP